MVHHGRTHILVQCHDCTACTIYITLEMHGCIHSAYCRMLDNDGSRLYVHTHVHLHTRVAIATLPQDGDSGSQSTVAR